MKKIILGATAILFVGTAFAQSGANTFNVSELTINGAGNSGSVNQAAMGGKFNYSTITQTNANSADVVQIGGNDSYITQVGLNTANVNQTNDGTGTGYQISRLDQNGLNIADIDQTGNSNFSNVTQVNTTQLLANEANVQQGQVDATSQNNISTVQQDNDGNFVRHIQDGVNNISLSRQVSAEMSAPALPMVSYLQGSHITQTGDRNSSTVLQNGDNQSSRVTQTAAIGGAVLGATNEATILQNGENNISEAFQNDWTMTDADNTLMVSQTNTMVLAGPGSSSLVTQNGTNTHTITQNN